MNFKMINKPKKETQEVEQVDNYYHYRQEDPKEIEVFSFSTPINGQKEPILKVLKGWPTIEIAYKEYNESMVVSKTEEIKKED